MCGPCAVKTGLEIAAKDKAFDSLGIGDKNGERVTVFYHLGHNGSLGTKSVFVEGKYCVMCGSEISK